MPTLKKLPTLHHLSAERLGHFIAKSVMPAAYICIKGESTSSTTKSPRDSQNVGSSNDTGVTTPNNLPGDENLYKLLPGFTKQNSSDVAKQQFFESDDEHSCSSECDVSQQKYNEVRDYLLLLTTTLTSHSHRTLHEQLMLSILPKLNPLYMKQPERTRALIRSIVPKFLNHSITEFDFGAYKMQTEVFMFKELFNQLGCAEHLEKLVFGRSCYWRSKSMISLSKVLHGLRNLRILHIHYICSPVMLKDLAHSCPQLSELSLKGSHEITDTELEYLAEFHNLETLDISGTSVTGKGCSAILAKIPDLTWLTHCPFNCNSDTIIFDSRADLFDYIKTQFRRQMGGRIVSLPTVLGESDMFNVEHDEGASVETISEKKIKPDIEEHFNEMSDQSGLREAPSIVLNFRKFWLFNPTSEELVLMLLCPNIEHLQLDFVMQDLQEEPETSVISNLSCLSTIILNIYDRCPIDMVTTVLQSSFKLTHLYLHLCDDWFFVAPMHNIIAQNCRHLQVLSMAGDYKGDHSLDESNGRLDFTLPPDGHPFLKEIHLTGCVSDHRLLHLLLQSPCVETLHLDGELEWLHDETFTAAFDARMLSQLKVLWFNVSTGITLLTVKRLLQVENRLERIGRLCLMAAATKTLYQELLLYVKKNNLDIELIWVTDQRELKI